jgi:RsmE family RNA methyltransferase
MGELSALTAPVTLAVGSERGWTEAELAALRQSGFEACSLGARILKTETAALAAVTLALARLGIL